MFTLDFWALWLYVELISAKKSCTFYNINKIYFVVYFYFHYKIRMNGLKKYYFFWNAEIPTTSFTAFEEIVFAIFLKVRHGRLWQINKTKSKPFFFYKFSGTHCAAFATKVPVFYCLMKKFKSLNFFHLFWPILTKLIEICWKSRKKNFFGKNLVIWIFSLNSKKQGLYQSSTLTINFGFLKQ